MSQELIQPTEPDLSGLDYLKELPTPRPHFHETRRFPEGFLWGSATSAYQVEGGISNNDWYDWEQTPGRVLDGTKCGLACDHYRRYEEDFDLAQEFGQNAHRLSIEWARIEPADGEFDAEALLHYRHVLEALKRRGMRTMVTIWHFTLPRWFAEQGGWEWSGAVSRFARYADRLAQEFGDLVDIWITINEPMVYLGQSYSIGGWPPGKKGIGGTVRVFWKLTRAHRAAYAALHHRLDDKSRGRRAQVGIAKNVITFEPYRPEKLTDVIFVWVADRFFNHQFFRFTRGRHDFIGINYYFHYRVKYLPRGAGSIFYEVHAENREQSDLGWEINAQAIFRAIMGMTRYRRPIYVTEHGVANADDGKRPRVIVSALKEVYHAIRAGADVRGYFHWSLLDNFEWEKGFAGRFGLFAIDYQTQRRTPRRSAYVYAEICRENGVPHRLLKFTGHGVRW